MEKKLEKKKEVFILLNMRYYCEIIDFRIVVSENTLVIC